MRNTDTIAAVATPAGPGGIGVIRISGQDAKTVLARIFTPLAQDFTDFRPRFLHYGRVCDANGATLDRALAVFMPGPHSFTGEDVAEIHCHGGISLLVTVLENICDPTASPGARPAGPGEFSRRAFLNGRMDLTQAEAVAELIAAPGKDAVFLSAAKLDGLMGRRVRALGDKLEHLRMLVCAAVDFPEEEIECLAPVDFARNVDEITQATRELLAGRERNRIRREGALLVLTGRPNVGKSSLMNALLGRERALVTKTPGTTRDLLEEGLVLDGLAVRLVDTAGLCESGDEAERLGMAAARSHAEEADIVLFVSDGSLGFTAADAALAAELPPDRTLLVWNKCDLARPTTETLALCPPELIKSEKAQGILVVSALSGEGLEMLATETRRAVLARYGVSDTPAPSELSPNLRQAHALGNALEDLELCARAVRNGLPYDVCALHLDGAAAALAEITGASGNDEILNRVFSAFCIGK